MYEIKNRTIEKKVCKTALNLIYLRIVLESFGHTRTDTCKVWNMLEYKIRSVKDDDEALNNVE